MRQILISIFTVFIYIHLLNYYRYNAISGNFKFNIKGLCFNIKMLFPQVNVFGFGADSDGNWSHYFEVLRNKQLKTGPHAGKEENKIIAKLHKRNKVVLYKGS